MSNTPLLSKENKNVIITPKLIHQKKIIDSFVKYLTTISNAMDTGKYNIEMIDYICTSIENYYATYNNSLEEDLEEEAVELESDNESDNESKKDSDEDSDEELDEESDESNESNKSQKITYPNYDEDIKKENKEEPKEIEKTKIVNPNNLYNNFINKVYEIDDICFKPKYDIEKNIINFINKSQIY